MGGRIVTVIFVPKVLAKLVMCLNYADSSISTYLPALLGGFLQLLSFFLYLLLSTFWSEHYISVRMRHTLQSSFCNLATSVFSAVTF